MEKQIKENSEGGRIYMNDKWFYRGVIIILGVISIGTVVGYIWLDLIDKNAPDALIAIGSAAGGALAGLFK